LTVLELLDQRIAELDRLIGEASAPKVRSDEDRGLEIMRANLRALRSSRLLKFEAGDSALRI